MAGGGSRMKVSEASELSSLVQSPMHMHTTAIKPNGLFAAQFQERNLREARSNTASSLPTGEQTYLPHAQRFISSCCAISGCRSKTADPAPIFALRAARSGGMLERCFVQQRASEPWQQNGWEIQEKTGTLDDLRQVLPLPSNHS